MYTSCDCHQSMSLAMSDIIMNDHGHGTHSVMDIQFMIMLANGKMVGLDLWLYWVGLEMPIYYVYLSLCSDVRAYF